MDNNDNFSDAFHAWLKGCQEIINKQFAEHYQNLQPSQLVYESAGHSRYIRVVRQDPSSKQRSAFAFIDKEGGKIGKFLGHKRGDILKPASWKAPAPHARGSIFDADNGMKHMNWTGPNYLK